MKRFLPLLAVTALAWLLVRTFGIAAVPAAGLAEDPGGTIFGSKPDPQKTRHYYVAAEPETWDYVPAGKDEVCGLPLPAPVAAIRENRKLRYVQYTDATFTSKVASAPSLGILGPVLRGVVGENLAVTFLNRSNQPLSMHPHGVKYDKDSEGSLYQPAPGKGAAVAPGARFTYVWQLDEASGPLPSEPSSKGWLYHSHVTGDGEANLGLVGAIIVTDPKRARPDGTPADVDREFATLFMIFDESGQGITVQDAPAAAAAAPGDVLKNLFLSAAQDVAKGPPPSKITFEKNAELVEQGQRMAINGRVFGNLPGLEMNEGERVRWYLFTLGSEQDFHTPHWHGVRVVEGGARRTDVVELLPGSMKVADLVADDPGSWLFHCHVDEHMAGGMFARFVIYPRDVVGADRSPARAFLGLGASQPKSP
jgi:FtsP/CotA-like multicopper oxidase with cupredoxin domain